MAAGAPELAASASGLQELGAAALQVLPPPAVAAATLAGKGRGNSTPVLGQTSAESETGPHGAYCCESHCFYDFRVPGTKRSPL